MLTLPSSVRIYLAVEPVDLRKSIDGLGALVTAQGGELYSGHLFVFRGRRADRIKILGWDRGGFVLYYKRLEKGRFRWPQLTPQAKEVVLDSTQLAMLLDGIDVQRVRRPAGWEPKQTGASGQTPLGG